MNDGTLMTTAVEGKDPAHDQLPSLEEAKTYKEVSQRSLGASEAGGGSRRRKRLLLIIVPLVLVIAVIALVVGLTTRNKSNSARNSNVQGDGTSPIADRLEATIKFLKEEGISNSQSLEDQTSPQYKAALWMSNYDPLQLQLSTQSSFLQRYVLVLLSYALQGQQWNQLGWLRGKSECYWSYSAKGAFCNSDDELIALHLVELNVSGSIPSEIGYLSTLQSLAMFQNSVFGSLPQTLFRLTALQNLDLQFNLLSGTISIDLLALTNLTALLLNGNTFHGSVPLLSSLTNLMEIGLDQNSNLTGQLDTFYNLPKLKSLYIDHNSFSGKLSNELFQTLPSLEEFIAGRNDFTSSLPSLLFSHKKLQALDLHLNHFTGTIPDTFSANNTIELLALYNNSLRGSIPTSITNLTNLKYLDLSDNSFTSTIPTTITQLSKLEYLFLAGNNFTPGPVPSGLQNLVKLADLSLQNTHRTGTIPEFVGSKLPRLRLLDLSYNSLNGSIPSLTKATNLLFLMLNRNELSGNALEAIFALQNLALIILDHNNLTTSFDKYCDNLNPVPYRLFITDCNDSKISCNCCKCCSASNSTCNSKSWLGTWVPLWEFGFSSRKDYYFNDQGLYFTLTPYG